MAGVQILEKIYKKIKYFYVESKELKTEYKKIIERLDAMTEEGNISVYVKKTLLEMSGKVLENIARKYENVREGVKSVMGGKVLEYEAKTILRQGMREGEVKKAKATAGNLRNLGMDADTIAQVLDVNVALVKQWFVEK